MRLTVYTTYCTLVGMTKAKRVKRKPARTPLQAWCDEYGHGARAYLADTAKLRWQTVHELYMGWRTATVPTAQKI